jgi:hypothetical protein
LFGSPGSQVDRTETPVFAKAKRRDLVGASHFDYGLLVDAEEGCGIGGMPRGSKEGWEFIAMKGDTASGCST